VRVIDRASRRLVQEIADIGGDEVSGSVDKVVTVIDASFDGHPDLVVPGTSGGAGPNFMWNFYLFDPHTRRFVFDANLSSLVQPSIGKDGTISQASRNGCCQHEAHTYRYEQGRLVEVASSEDVLPPSGDWVILTEGRRVGAQMRYVVRRKAAAEY